MKTDESQNRMTTTKEIRMTDQPSSATTPRSGAGGVPVHPETAEGAQGRVGHPGLHTLVVSYEPLTPDLVGVIEPQDEDLLEAHLECSGVTDACRTWWECFEPHVILEKGWTLVDMIYEGEDLWHGVEHQVIDGMAMVPSEQCIGTAFDGAQEAIREAAIGRAPGRWSVAIGYEGDEYVRIDHLAPVSFITERVLARAAYEARKLARATS